jgi:hypothetical protein
MSWTVEYAPENGMAVVTAFGEMRDEDARAQTAETVYLLKHNHAAAVVVDYSDAVLEVSLARLYWLPDYATQLGAPWDTRVAVVLPRRQYQLESYEFFTFVCKNAGYDVRLFDAIAAAENWLALSPPAPQQAAHPAHA